MRVIPEDMDDPSLEARRIGMQQIDETLGKLHAKAIVWGDGQPENISIDGRAMLGYQMLGKDTLMDGLMKSLLRR